MNTDLCKYFSSEEIADALFQIGPLMCKDFSSEEIADALFQIGPLKALGPDGSGGGGGEMPPGVNDTAIVLISNLKNNEQDFYLKCCCRKLPYIKAMHGILHHWTHSLHSQIYSSH
jgi:hypothetical protein